MDLTDVLYEKRDGVAWITINRPERRNAFRGRTVSELIGCFHDAWHDRAVGVAVLTGAGDKAFCSVAGASTSSAMTPMMSTSSAPKRATTSS